MQSGQAGLNMVNVIAGELNSTPIKYFADWTDRIAAGELPHAKPQRPQVLPIGRLAPQRTLFTLTVPLS